MVVLLVTIMRREIYLKQRAIEMGISVLYVDEAVSSTALAHDPGWLDVIVDSVTGEEVEL